MSIYHPVHGQPKCVRSSRGKVVGHFTEVRSSAPISLGRPSFQRGINQIVVEIVGKDPCAQGYSEGYLAGVDGFLLRR